MIAGKKDLGAISIFLIILIIGVYGIYSVPYVFVNQTFNFVKQYLFLVLLFSFSLSYYLIFIGQKKEPFLKNIVLFIVFFIMMSMMTFLCVQGISMIINKNFGTQKKYLLSGKIIKLNYPLEKKIGNKYGVFIRRDLEKDTIEMNVPTNEYFVGQDIKKEMKIGLLEFVYSEK